jgi:hypothetical protein
MRFCQLNGLLLAATSLLAVSAIGQGQVDTQVGPVDNRVGGELYGHNDSPARPRGYQTRLLPSEERFARWRSGALPSEIEMNRAAIGPLTPNGEIDYIPRRSPLQQAMKLPEPQLYNPAYDQTLRIDGRVNAESSSVPAGYPLNAQDGMLASARIAGTQIRRLPRRPDVPPQAQQVLPIPQQSRPVEGAIPSLTPAPDAPLPTGQLYDNVKYVPASTPGAVLMNRTQIKVKTPPKPKSLADEPQKP